MNAPEMLAERTCASFDCSKPARPNWLRCDACLARIAAEKREALDREEELHREYFITPSGRVFSAHRWGARSRGPVREMKRYLCNGYLRLGLSVDGVQIPVFVHRLLLLVFVGSPADTSMEACHFDGDRTNNDLGNLRWGTSAENAADRARHGREGMKLHPEKHARGPMLGDAVRRGIAASTTRCLGEAHPGAKLTAADIPNIRRRAVRGESDTEIAQRFGVARATIYFVRTNRSWRSVAQETGT